MSSFITDSSYRDLLREVKEKIRSAQVQARVTVNQHLLILYWEVGKSILARQEQYGWGAKVVEQLAHDLRLEFPGLEGYSKRNLLYMRQFANAYPEFPIVQAPLAQISWYHNITLLQKCPDEQKRFWYAAAALEHGWSRDIMVHHVEVEYALKDLTKPIGVSEYMLTDALPVGLKSSLPSVEDLERRLKDMEEAG